MSDDEIGTLNLREFDALLQRKDADDKRMRLNAGIIAASILNSAPFGDPNRKAVSPLEFVPDCKAEEPDLTEMTPDEQKAYLISMFGKHIQYKRR